MMEEVWFILRGSEAASGRWGFGATLKSREGFDRWRREVKGIAGIADKGSHGHNGLESGWKGKLSSSTY